MSLDINVLQPQYLQQFKKDMQEAFQQGAREFFGETDEQILPESHIEQSLNAQGAVAYQAVADGKLVGGAIVVVNCQTQHNHLDFLYVKNGVQGKGIGLAIWQSLEKLYPKTKVWETVTPYFEKRNVHFYVNKCGFHIVGFFNKWHSNPNDSDEYGDDYFDGMFRLEKVKN